MTGVSLGFTLAHQHTRMHTLPVWEGRTLLTHPGPTVTQQHQTNKTPPTRLTNSDHLPTLKSLARLYFRKT